MGARRFLKNLVSGAVTDAMNRQPQVPVKSARQTVYIGGDLLLTTTIYGQKMFLLASDRSLTPHIALDGYWEQWITDAFLRIVKPGMQVVDVGANVGYYTLLAAEHVGSKGKVTAFEANPSLAEIVYRNVHVNGFMDRVDVIGKAAFSEERELSFTVYKNYKGSSGIWGSPEHAAIYRDEVELIKVPAVPLDIQLAGQKVDFIKIDAEGAEAHILIGAKKIIAENSGLQLMVEYAPRMIESAFGSIEGFHDLLAGMGLKPHVVNHDSSLTAMTFQELAGSGIAHCDMVLKRAV